MPDVMHEKLMTFLYIWQTFTKNDENFVEAFAIFCGMGIHNTHMYEKAIVAMAKQSVTLEVLSYHASASIEDALRLRVNTITNHAKMISISIFILPSITLIFQLHSMLGLLFFLPFGRILRSITEIENSISRILSVA